MENADWTTPLIKYFNLNPIVVPSYPKFTMTFNEMQFYDAS